MNVTICSGSVGYNNKITPHRLPFNKGVSALEAADDILIDKTGEIVTRRDVTTLNTNEYHSTWKVGNSFLIGYGDKIQLATPNNSGVLSFTTIVTGLRGTRLHYVTLDGWTYYANGTDYGRIKELVNEDWPQGEWNLTDRSTNKKQFPVGTCLEVLSGRIITSVGKKLIFSEYGQIGIYDVVNNRRFESDIQMIASVQTGLYVSDSEATYFIEGRNPKTWTIKKCFDYPCYNKNQDLVNPANLGFETSALSCLLASTKGPVLGFPDGTTINLIEKNVELPECGMQGSIMVVDETLILQSH